MSQSTRFKKYVLLRSNTTYFFTEVVRTSSLKNHVLLEQCTTWYFQNKLPCMILLPLSVTVCTPMHSCWKRSSLSWK